MNQISAYERDYGMILVGNVCIIQTEDEEDMDLLNFDISTYEFESADLEMAVKCLKKRDREILILYLMGHTQESIGEKYNVTRSMISKRFKVIMERLQRYFL